MTKRKQQEVELEAALHGIKLKGTAPRLTGSRAADLDHQLAAGRISGYRIRSGVRGQPSKPKK